MMYFNLFHQRYLDAPVSGFKYWLAFRPNCDGRDPSKPGQLYRLAYGMISKPYCSADCAAADLADLTWPDAVKRQLRIVRAACAMARADSWIDVPTPAAKTTLCRNCSTTTYYH